MPEVRNHLVLSVMAPWRDELLGELFHEIANKGCEIQECRASPLGESFAAQVLVGGNWSSVGKLETALESIAEKLSAQIHHLRTDDKKPRPELRPFAAEVNAPAQPNLLAHLSDFLTSQGVLISECVSQDYEAGQTGARMVNIQLGLYVPLTQQPPALRESFMDLCDELNADGLFDPIKS